MNNFEKFIDEFRGIPKNSLLRLRSTTRNQVSSIKSANDNGLKHIILKSSELSIGFKTYHPKERGGVREFDLQLIKSDINQIKNSMGKI